MFERTRIDANGSEPFSETPRNLNRVQRGAASLRRLGLEGSRRGPRYRARQTFSCQDPTVPVIPSPQRPCHPERSEGSAPVSPLLAEQIPRRFARDVAIAAFRL